MEKEIWKPVMIKGFEGCYEASSLGQIKSLDRIDSYRSGRFRKERILKQTEQDGYNHLFFSKTGVKRNFAVHRIIAETFLPNIENKPQVNHKNGIRNDNRVVNLEWCTGSENAQHSRNVLGNIYNSMTGKFGVDHPAFGKGVLLRKAKKVKCDTLDIEFNSANDAARLLGISQPHLSAVCRGEKKHSQGLTFRYL